MRTEQWMASARMSWGVEFDLRTYRNPRERLLLFCEIKGECWVSSRRATFIDGVEVLVQRAAYGLFVGPIRKGDEIIPLCANKRCCCPDHLHLVPHEAIDAAKKMRLDSLSVPASSQSPTPHERD